MKIKSNKRLFRGIATAFVISLILLTANSAFAAFAGGDGSEGNPYQIANVDQLQEAGSYLSSHFILINDIDASATQTWNSGAGFDPIGDDMTSFAGTFDGQGYVITDIYINRIGEGGVGLFGYTVAYAEIRNTGIVNANVKGNIHVGGLVGNTNIDTTVENSYCIGNIIGNNSVGGLVGENSSGTITNSYSTGNVRGDQYVGGLVGYNDAAIENSYSTVSVNGLYAGGGLVGLNNVGSVINSYSTGSVNENDSNGGFVGLNNSGTVTNCFWNTDTSGQTSSDGGTGKTNSEMILQATFTGWDFSST